MNETATDALARHIIASALETAYDDRTPDDVEWEYQDWTIEDIRGTDDGVIEVIGTQADYQTRGGKFDYEVYEGTIRCHVYADFTQQPLAGDIDTAIEWVGGAPPDEPPVPDPHEV